MTWRNSSHIEFRRGNGQLSNVSAVNHFIQRPVRHALIPSHTKIVYRYRQIEVKR